MELYVHRNHSGLLGTGKWKHGALRPQKPLRLIRDGKMETWSFTSTETIKVIRDGEVWGIWNFYIYHQLATLSPQEWLCIRVGSCVSHFNVSFVVWAKSQDSVHKPLFLKRKDSRSGSNRSPSAYQPSALPPGHTGSQSPRSYWPWPFYPRLLRTLLCSEATSLSFKFAPFSITIKAGFRKIKYFFGLFWFMCIENIQKRKRECMLFHK